MTWKKTVITDAKKIIEMYPDKRSALGPLLYLALREEGYVSKESIKVQAVTAIVVLMSGYGDRSTFRLFDRASATISFKFSTSCSHS